MTDLTVYLGPESVGGSVPGLDAAFASVGSALTALSSTVTTQLAVLTNTTAQLSIAVNGLNGISGALNIVSDAVLTAKTAIRIPATVDFQAQLDAALAIGVQLTADLSDPTTYLTSLLAGLSSVQGSLALALPTVQLTGQISATAAVAASMSVKIATVDLQLVALDSIAASIDAQAALMSSAIGSINAVVNAFNVISLALSVAITAVASALSIVTGMTGVLVTAGARCLLYTGELQGLGASFDGVSPSIGLSPTTVIRCPIVFVETSDTNAVSALNAVFKTS